MKNAPIVLGLGGLKESGKDTVADYLAERHGFVKFGMSDPLHAALLVLDPVVHITRDEANKLWAEGIDSLGTYMRYSFITEQLGYVRAKEIADYRRLLQVFGTDIGRNMIGEDTWLNSAKRTIADEVAAGNNVVLTSTRFPNEIQMIEKFGGSTWWVHREFKRDEDLHASEQSVGENDFGHVIMNITTYADLYENVEKALKLTEPARA